MFHCLKKIIRSTSTFSIMLLLFASLSSIEVRAETSETLLNKYGLTLGGPDKTSIGFEISSITDDMYSAETAKTFIEVENMFTDYHKENNSKKIDSLNKSLDVVLQQNSKITLEIKDMFTMVNIHELLKKDKEYKNNVVKANNILADLDILNDITYSYTEFEYDFEGMEELLYTKKLEYEEAKKTYDLGDVTNVKFPMRVERHVNSRYGNRIDPLNKNVTRFHSGTDYRASTGTELYALFNGVVSSCGWSDTSGYFIVIESGENVKTFVCHLSKILVEKGQYVNQYDLIGLTGGTGSRSTGPHLHIALYLNGATYDIDRLFS